jgi:cysteine-rich repeat protein
VHPRPTVVAALLAMPAVAAAAPTFTGDVPTDFSDPSDLVFADPAGLDVGVPTALNGAISGHDMEDVRLAYDAVTDTLFIGINTFGIATDADGDGNPDGTSPELAGLGGVDEALIGGTESFAFFADLDEDGVLDVIAGVPAGADASGYRVSSFLGTPVAPGVSFGPPLDAIHQGSFFGAPTASTPDLEFTITAFSQLPTSSGAAVGTDFSIGLFVGSLSDAGIGEDFFPGVFQFTPVDVGSCGDGIVDPGEQCDDGNTLDGDGCSATCDTEDGFVCECAGGDAFDLQLEGASDLIGGTTASFRGVFECPDGEVLYGVTGDFVDNCPGVILTMDLLCAIPAVDPDTGAVVLSPQGPIPGVRPDGSQVDLPQSTYSLTCPADQVLVGFSGESGIAAPFNPIRTTGVSELEIECASVDVIDNRVQVSGSAKVGPPVAQGNPLPGDTDVACSLDQFGSGIGGWGRTYLDGARIVCSSATAGCGGEPSVCRPFEDCGDGVAEGFEACDDGNNIDGDGCSATCEIEVCGDGIVQPGEACDDGNNVDGDGCSATCDTECPPVMGMDLTSRDVGRSFWFSDLDGDGSSDRYALNSTTVFDFDVETGLASYTGSIVDRDHPGDVWTFDFTFAYRGQGDAGAGSASPYIYLSSPSQAQIDEWLYFDLVTGELTNTHDGSRIEASPRPADGSKPMQLGFGANGFNLEYGFAVWFGGNLFDGAGNFVREIDGDINTELEELDDTCPTAPPCTGPECVPVEICDGLDNDGDGEIDEGFTTSVVYTFDDYEDRNHVERSSTATLDYGNGLLTYELIIDDDGHDPAEGFTLALNDGPNPNGEGNLAMLYFDGTTTPPTLTAYGYNGVRGSQSSWYDGSSQSGTQTPDRILSAHDQGLWVLDIGKQDLGDETRFFFTIDIVPIILHQPLYYNAAGWYGIGFDDFAGQWMHPFAELHTSYDHDGYLNGWNGKQYGWIDSDHVPTDSEAVCVPSNSPID